jgi:hypothetical protein
MSNGKDSGEAAPKMEVREALWSAVAAATAFRLWFMRQRWKGWREKRELLLPQCKAGRARYI